jgi:hypothetical protein
MDRDGSGYRDFCRGSFYLAGIKPSREYILVADDFDLRLFYEVIGQVDRILVDTSAPARYRSNQTDFHWFLFQGATDDSRHNLPARLGMSLFKQD